MKYFLFILVSLCLSLSAYAQDATLEWEQSPTPDIDGYRIWYQATPYVSGQWDGAGAIEGDSPIDVGDVLTFDVTGLTDDVLWWFTATTYKNAYCSDAQYVDQATCEAATETWTEYAESDYSNVVRTSSGGKLFIGGMGRFRFPAPEEPSGRVTF